MNGNDVLVYEEKHQERLKDGFINITHSPITYLAIGYLGKGATITW